jgi:ribosomal protein S18 acetylase RimI-like enzyme
MKPSDQPIRLDVSKRERAAALLARAFQDDPLYRAVLPDEAKRRKASLWLHDRMLRYCLLYGTTHTLPSLEGVACWLHPGQTEVTIGRIVRSGLLAMPLRMGPAAFLRFSAYIDFSSKLREEKSPDSYWYLWVLAVDPSYQGKGVGGRLIRPVLERADASGTACYLETENAKNLAFYERHGFRIVAEERVPRLGVPTWSMIREPVSGEKPPAPRP